MIIDKNTWNRLVQKLGRERLPHALLLHGPRGVGKLALAERFAQLLLCEATGGPVEPCGNCDGCRWFEAGHHPDIRFVEPETLARFAVEDEAADSEKTEKRKPSAEIRIEQVRALADFLNLGSHRGGRRIAIVHPAEDMNAHAANSLLKALEEPPGGAMFLLVSHRPARLLPTIRSRCVPVPVPLPEAGASRRWLDEQGVQGAERWLAYAGGAPRRALELATGAPAAMLEPILRALAGGDTAGLLDLSGREELELLVDALQKHAFDQALAAIGAPPKYFIDGPAAPTPQSARPWVAYLRALGRSRALARHPLNPRLFAADLLADMP